MSASNNRNREYNTVHHLVNRIAHRVYFLGEEQRADLMAVVRRVAAFGGLKLLGWCIMTNHFHFLVYLPVRETLSEEQVMDRIQILKGIAGRRSAEMQIAAWRLRGEDALAEKWFDRQRKRMYDVGAFMKIVKQWFTEEYNRRESHVGTLWESVYHDFNVPLRTKDMTEVLGYIHLNPIRSGASSAYDEYDCSSFTSLRKGDDLALEGLRFAYSQPTSTREGLAAQHIVLMDSLLEEIKRQRAEAIAVRRAAGFQMNADPLTSEAMIEQARAHLEEVRKEAVSNAGAGMPIPDPESRCAGVDRRLLTVIRLCPDASVASLAEQASLPVPTVYRRLRALQAGGIIYRETRNDPWIIKVINKVRPMIKQV